MMGSVCHAEDITIRYKGATAKVDQKVKDNLINHKLGTIITKDPQSYVSLWQDLRRIVNKH